MRVAIAFILALTIYVSIGLSMDILHVWISVILLQILAGMDIKMFGKGRDAK